LQKIPIIRYLFRKAFEKVKTMFALSEMGPDLPGFFPGKLSGKEAVEIGGLTARGCGFHIIKELCRVFFRRGQDLNQLFQFQLFSPASAASRQVLFNPASFVRPQVAVHVSDECPLLNVIDHDRLRRE